MADLRQSGRGLKLVFTWVSYYGAERYCVHDVDERFFDLDQDNIAEALDVAPPLLLYIGLGTNWQEVQSRDLEPSHAWFAQGDPWNALIGIGRNSVTVTALKLTPDQYVGPGTLRKSDPEFIHRRMDLMDIHNSVQTVRKIMRRRWKLCADCQSPRLGSWCNCAGPVQGISYD